MKLAAFDFDGTILFPDGIAQSTAEAIRAWQEAGHLAVAATGKSLSAAQHALDGFDVSFDYSVLFTGAVVADRQSRVLHSAALDTDVVRRVVGHLATVENIAVYGTMLHGRDVRFSSTITGDAQTNILRDHQELDPADIAGHEFIGVPVWVPGNPALQQRIQTWITENFNVGCVSNQSFIDIIPVGTTKGTGLAWLGNHLGVDRSEVEIHTFGDSWNDLPMHAIADHSYSFPWSPEEVHAATDEVIDSVAETLRRLL
ncbi:HAD family phosphatase [Corynebacterium hylobatis]|uniref:HAD family phosphatase n=1 Tax=Corynebacterium hylobatis TaxID=1859290 RepID=A0A3R9ZIC6_9CORY|nr:HAD family hydrolase [Corynebacterium hylobatis]RSZ62362.1 HAD family phosphatase [Corynebacterium hylobatis]